MDGPWESSNTSWLGLGRRFTEHDSVCTHKMSCIHVCSSLSALPLAIHIPWYVTSGNIYMRSVDMSTVKNVVAAFAAQGTPIDLLQMGNEINKRVFGLPQAQTLNLTSLLFTLSGLLWPSGNTGTAAGWQAASQFLYSARQGARAAGFNGKFMIHLADGWNQVEQLYFYQNVFIQGTLRQEYFLITLCGNPH